MRWLPAAVTLLLAWSVLAADTRSAVRSTSDASVALPIPAERFRLRGNLDLCVVSADGDDLVLEEPGISSNVSSSELRTWRPPETFGYYPCDRGVGARDGSSDALHGEHSPSSAAGRRMRF